MSRGLRLPLSSALHCDASILSSEAGRIHHRGSRPAVTSRMGKYAEGGFRPILAYLPAARASRPAARRWGLRDTRDLRVSTKQQPPEPASYGQRAAGRAQAGPPDRLGRHGAGLGSGLRRPAGGRLAVKVWLQSMPRIRHGRPVLRRGRAASAIDDPNILKIYGTGRTEDGRPRW